jgi:predicted O-methyltransferase YrrM
MQLDELLDAFELDEPRVHRARYRELDEGETAPGIWGTKGTQTTERSCYELLARSVEPGSTTIETGLGLSTLIFANQGCEHTAFFLDPLEEDRLRGWASQYDIDLGTVRFVVGPSDSALRALEPAPVDLFLIDGGHGYPLPQLDWFYGAPRLRTGGVLVLDDLQLWGPRQLDTFLDLDPRWERLERTTKWSAYRRLVDGPVAEDFDTQTFLPTGHLRNPNMNWKGRLVHSLPAPIRDRAVRWSVRRR